MSLKLIWRIIKIIFSIMIIIVIYNLDNSTIIIDINMYPMIFMIMNMCMINYIISIPMISTKIMRIYFTNSPCIKRVIRICYISIRNITISFITLKYLLLVFLVFLIEIYSYPSFSPWISYNKCFWLITITNS